MNFGQTKPLPSLFGSLGTTPSTSAPPPSQSQPAPTSSIFATVATSSQSVPQQSSLFPTLGTPKPPASTSPFGALGSAQPLTTASASGGGGGVFGTSLSQPTTTASGGGLFGGLQPQATTAASGGSIFGNFQLQGTTAASGGSIFGNLQPQTTAASGGQGGGIGASLQQSQGGQLQEQAGQQNADPSKAPQPVYFNNLLEKGRKRTLGRDGDSGFGDLPSLQLGLGDIARRARELGGMGTQNYGGAASDSKALACEGIHLVSLRVN